MISKQIEAWHQLVLVRMDFRSWWCKFVFFAILHGNFLMQFLKFSTTCSVGLETTYAHDCLIRQLIEVMNHQIRHAFVIFIIINSN